MSKITCIGNPDCKAKMLEMGLGLFRSHDPFEVPFKPGIEACLMFHPPERDDRDYDYIEKEEYEAVVAAAKNVGDTGFVLCHNFGHFKEGVRAQVARYWHGEGVNTFSRDLPTASADDEYKRPLTLEPAVDEFKRYPTIEAAVIQLPTFWWCEFPTYEDYLEIPFARLNDAIVFSINGRWALLTTHECWTLVGGDTAFIRQVDKLHPTWRHDMLALLDKCSPMERTSLFGGLLIELLDYWKKWPGDEWVDTFAAKLDQKLTGGL